MCGIVGIYSEKKDIDRLQVKKASTILKHRGPDDYGFYFSDNVALAHRRLAIIDLSRKAKQPISNESQNLWLVYNGEIYNFQQLKQELQDKGHEFKSKSDSEVVLHAYEEWHETCLEKFNGMFAFAIWDEKNKQLFLARDRVGIKPLYYWFNKEKFIFSSEIKAILEFGIEKKINRKILYDYFNYFISIGNETLFEKIRTIPPAHYLILKRDKMIIKRYWNFDYNIENRQEHILINELKKKLSKSIKQRLISDVPLGVFLSGGIDSSTIVSLMSKFCNNIKTFSVGSGDYLELNIARKVAEHFNTEHHEILIEAEKFAKAIEDMIWHADMPLAWPSFIPLYFVSKLARGKATVVLTGEGADELFAGYRRYYIIKKAIEINRKIRYFAKLKNILSNLGSKIYDDVRYKKYIAFLFKGIDFDYITGVNILIDKERDYVINSKEIPKNNILKKKVIALFNEKNTEFINRLLYVDFNTYLIELLMKQDKMSMAASIESRVPFLDHEIVEFASKLPVYLKLNKNIGKYILKKSMSKLLPKKIIYQKKKGFPVPIERWFRKELNGFVRDNLDDGIIKRFFNKRYVDRIIEKHKKHNYSLQLWALLNFKIWYEKFIER